MPDDKTEPDQAKTEEKPQTEQTPSQPVQSVVEVETPLTGSSKAEKTMEYLRRLRQRGEFDPTSPLSNDHAREIASSVSKLAGEEFSPSTIKDARTRLLKEPVQRSLATRSDESSHPTLKVPPPPEPYAAPAQPPPLSKPPLTPQEVESNRSFFARFLKWVREKAEAKVDQADEEFIVGTLTDALTDANSKIPAALKIFLAVVMAITLYAYPAINKVRDALQKMRERFEGAQQ